MRTAEKGWKVRIITANAAFRQHVLAINRSGAMQTAFLRTAAAAQAPVRPSPPSITSTAPSVSCRSSSSSSSNNSSSRSAGSGVSECQLPRQRCCRTRAIWDSFKLPTWGATQPSPEQQVTDALLLAIEGTQRGLSTSPAARAEIEELVVTLEELQGEAETTGPGLSATWELVWTTEKETLWIVKNAGLFRTSAGGVYQVIDVDAGTLQNVIEFPPEGSFVVDSSISVESERRVRFQFTSATLNLPNGKDLRLPPFGKGWFDTVFLGKDIRVARDIRGDILVCRRAGAPRQF